MRKAGKVLAGWSNGNDDARFTCGCPPTCSDIVTEKEKVQSFIESLMGHNNHVPKAVKEILVANMLRFWDDFIEILDKEPNGKYKDVMEHPFVNRVHKALLRSGVSNDGFKAWCSEVTSGFYVNNAFSSTMYYKNNAKQQVVKFPQCMTYQEHIDMQEQVMSKLLQQNHELLTHMKCMMEKVNRLEETVQSIVPPLDSKRPHSVSFLNSW